MSNDRPVAGTQPGSSKLRLTQLDSLRGLAALSVFWFHAFGMLAVKPAWLAFIMVTPIGALFNGRSAVWLFFVLSGFVLNLKYVETGKYPRFWKTDFLVRRVFRLYPAFLVILLLAFVLKAFVFNPSVAYAIYPDGFAEEWKMAYSTSDIARLVTLMLPGVKLHINPPVWSLVEEMRVALLFPFLIIAVNRWAGKIPNLLVLLGSYAIGLAMPHVSTLQYLPHFVLGAICARHVRVMSAWLQSQVTAVRYGWLLLAFCLYSASTVIPGVASLKHSVQFAIYQAVGFGAAGIIIYFTALVSPTGIMGSKPMRFLGETSYSFYLSHYILMCALSFWVIKSTGSVVIAWFVVLAIVYFLSYLIYNFIEEPMNRIGHRALPTVLGLQPIQNAGARPSAASVTAGATSRQPVEASNDKQDLR